MSSHQHSFDETADLIIGVRHSENGYVQENPAPVGVLAKRQGTISSFWLP